VVVAAARVLLDQMVTVLAVAGMVALVLHQA